MFTLANSFFIALSPETCDPATTTRGKPYSRDNPIPEVEQVMDLPLFLTSKEAGRQSMEQVPREMQSDLRVTYRQLDPSRTSQIRNRQNKISEMKRKFNMTDEGKLEDFLGINIKQHEDGLIHLTQPHLIDQILEQLHFRENKRKRRW
jgi:hypothetical protein